ncbi:hypothetical protein [Adhaeribacter arboris]|uniref:hypothetical protein n=1 Tax=Adhaeribacter arboris TaxID=2072846 RepID=UPI0018EABAAE|nr:hypothetical protein [Adhaeribacter arboris]
MQDRKIRVAATADVPALVNLKEKSLRSVTLLPLGYRNAAIDWLAKQKKVRRNLEKLFWQIT